MAGAGDRFDWVDAVTKVAGALGFNPVRVRWKLEGLRRRAAVAQHRASEQVQHVRYRHKTCWHCGAVMDRSERACPSCGEKAASWALQVLERIGFAVPRALTSTLLIGLPILAVYARIVIAEGGGGAFGVSGASLLEFGAHTRSLTMDQGEWWRLGTALFVHIGLMHLAFNLVALSQIAPEIESLYGRGAAVFAFLATGLLGNVASELWTPYALAAGASGGLMGLVGMSAGWGQRDGTQTGKRVRNRMLSWGLYTLAFGFLVHADHAAHAGGFLSGALFGWAVRPRSLELAFGRPLRVAAGLLGTAGVLAFGGLALFPGESRRAAAETSRAAQRALEVQPALLEEEEPESEVTPEELRAIYRRWRKSCELHWAGRNAEAVALLSSGGDLPPGLPSEEFVKSSCDSLREVAARCRLSERPEGPQDFCDAFNGAE